MGNGSFNQFEYYLHDQYAAEAVGNTCNWSYWLPAGICDCTLCIYKTLFVEKIIEKIIEKIKYEGHPMGVLGAPRIFVLKVHTTMIRDIFEEVCQPSVHHHHE